ncbi:MULTISPECIES: alanine/ornithine racemase family PLP-dependent enzyme [unclassified Halanaerobium]|uniref:alanine/ornithine racemase family PLP-dependent enzyme n=1 Tax=unclassified Halanaerobium TaxID=2641197 RepID=UPI000DF265E8|nr:MULTISPECIES: alanine/ornithine racemase family PLP-dependent enzyme [unclassified Halanaerobium]RCW41708.1 putative amino acid racemase [Halanaerobium sp. MA284_MarDTE_T2]RCW79281.1 putative amino acid racemase [Halanaerobium sp. DL-01]
MNSPYIAINTKKIQENTRYIVDLAKKNGVEIYGVGKASCADIKVAQAMLKGGVKGLADSRISNIKKLKENIEEDIPLMLLRIPMLSEVKKVVKFADISLNSEIKVIEQLNKAAKNLNKNHKIILMVDVGDRREGIMPDKVLDTVSQIINFDKIELIGLGTNLACFGGVIPTYKNLKILIDLKTEIYNKFKFNLNIISGGNSSSLPLLKDNGFPEGVNQLRVGETILLGNNVLNRERFFEAHQDTFFLSAEIVELKIKPAQPKGERAENAFGEKKVITKTGLRKRAILAVGRQDIDIAGLTPLLAGLEIEDGSSDHLIVDVTNSEKELKIGDSIKFNMNYGALLKAFTSKYVDKIYIT